LQDGLWTERERFHDDLKLVVKWLFSREARRLKWTLLSFVSIYIAAYVALYLWNPNLIQPSEKERAQHTVHAVDLLVAFTPFFLCALALACAITFKAQLIRLDRRLEVKHAAHYRSRLMREFADKQTRFYDECEEWKAKTQAELYEMILDQVERGIIKPRPEHLDDSYDFPKWD
jgi:hypothetical protein